MEALDVVIIGAGPIGLACGIEASKANLNYLIIDKGCLVNSLYHYPKHMTFFSTSDRLEIGGVPFISHGPKPVRSEALEYYRRVASSWNLKINLYEQVNDVQPAKGGYCVNTAKNSYQARKIIIASGFYDIPYLMNVDGEELAKVRHYYDEPHPYGGQKVLVVGAANSAVDVALDTYRAGAEVTMVMRGDGLKESVKYWVKPDIENRIKEGSIKAFYHSTVVKITKGAVEIETPHGLEVVENDFVLAMTGYRPDFNFLKSVGVHINDDDLHTPQYDLDTNETNLPGIYLAGVICGGLKTNKWFIENSRPHAEIIINHIAAQD